MVEVGSVETRRPGERAAGLRVRTGRRLTSEREPAAGPGGGEGSVACAPEATCC